jgi:hypothetical protein
VKCMLSKEATLPCYPSDCRECAEELWDNMRQIHDMTISRRTLRECQVHDFCDEVLGHPRDARQKGANK